jgi:tripartite-type tricarboxylate transporter receptor subunit TctC
VRISGARLAPVIVIVAGLVAQATSVGAQREPYPTKVVRIISDSAAGSANDSASRILADKLSAIWGQQVLTVNQPGAGGGISARVASQAAPDGYTIYMPATSPFLALAGAPGVAPNLPLELPRDFVPIGFILQQPLFIGASFKSGITSIGDLIARAREKPGAINYAATGRGRLTHLTMELLQARTNIKLQLVPYAGGPAQAMSDVLEGRVELVLDAYAGLASVIQGNLIKGLASTALTRLPGFENLPTVAETVPGFVVGAWAILVAPLGTPDAIVRKVNADLNKVLDDPEVLAKFATNGAFVRHMTPEEVTAFVQSEQTTWRPILQAVASEVPK